MSAPPIFVFSGISYYLRTDICDMQYRDILQCLSVQSDNFLVTHLKPLLEEKMTGFFVSKLLRLPMLS